MSCIVLHLSSCLQLPDVHPHVLAQQEAKEGHAGRATEEGHEGQEECGGTEFAAAWPVQEGEEAKAAVAG